MADPTNDERREHARARLAARGVSIVHEDNHLLGVVKPAGLPSQGGGDIGDDRHLVALIDTYRREAESKSGRAFVGLVHRLDRNVGGILVVAKTSKASSRLSALFRERGDGLEKEYLAWVAGHPEGRGGELVDRLRREGKVTRGTFADDPEGRVARLAWSLEASGRRASRLRIRLETGIAHQIRAQLSLMGHPILGDVKYGGRQGRLLGLFARRLAFPHPVGGAPVELVAPVPDGLRQMDRALQLKPRVGA